MKMVTDTFQVILVIFEFHDNPDTRVSIRQVISAAGSQVSGEFHMLNGECGHEHFDGFIRHNGPIG